MSSFGGTVKFVVTHVASTGDLAKPGGMGQSSTIFEIYVNDTFINYAIEGIAFSFSSQGVTFNNVTIDDLGIPYEYDDTITIQFSPDTITTAIPTTGVDFIYGILGCEGCVATQTADPTVIVSDIKNQPVLTFTSGNVKIFKGLGQWYTNLLRYNFIDSDVSLSSLAYREWKVNLIHRLGALIRPDSLNIQLSQGVVPLTGYKLYLKRSTGTQSLWISALRIQVVQLGTKTLAPNGLYVPVGAGSDWVFRVEIYTNDNPSIEYKVLDTTGPFTDFTALGGTNCQIQWNRYTNYNSTATTTMPLQITGIQNVLNFVYGYVNQLEENGFYVTTTDQPLIDSQTGRNIDWQLEVEKFINALYIGTSAGNGTILNPFMNKLYLQTPNGLLGRFNETKFIDSYSSQACYDVTGAVIPLNNLKIIRTDSEAIIYPSTPIFFKI